MNPYKSRYSLWLELTDRVSPTPDNEYMARGRQFEPFAANMYAAAHPEYEVCDNLTGNGESCFVRDDEFDFITGQPDRILFKNDEPVAGLEIKTASTNTIGEWGDYGTDQIPQHYLLQTQHYMGLTGIHDWKLSCLFFGFDHHPVSYREYEIIFDNDLWNFMRNAAVAFWNEFVVPQKSPPADSFDSTVARYVKERFPRNIHPLESATPDEELLIAECFNARKKADDAAREFDSAKTRLMLSIGDRDGIYSSNGKITWKRSKDIERTDWKAIVDDIGVDREIIKKHTKTTDGTRRFVMSASKG